MEQFCLKCNISHSRPVGQWCIRVSMATNISNAQASVAASAVRSMQNVGTPLSPISSLRTDTSTSIDQPDTSSTAASQAQNAVPSKTEQ